MPSPQTEENYHSQLGPPAKGLEIKGLVVGQVVWLGSMIDGMGLQKSASIVVWSHVVVRMAIELKYHNIPQIHTDTYKLFVMFRGTNLPAETSASLTCTDGAFVTSDNQQVSLFLSLFQFNNNVYIQNELPNYCLNVVMHHKGAFFVYL